MTQILCLIRQDFVSLLHINVYNGLFGLFAAPGRWRVLGGLGWGCSRGSSQAWTVGRDEWGRGVVSGGQSMLSGR